MKGGRLLFLITLLLVGSAQLASASVEWKETVTTDWAGWPYFLSEQSAQANAPWPWLARMAWERNAVVVDVESKVETTSFASAFDGKTLLYNSRRTLTITFRLETDPRALQQEFLRRLLTDLSLYLDRLELLLETWLESSSKLGAIVQGLKPLEYAEAIRGAIANVKAAQKKAEEVTASPESLTQGVSEDLMASLEALELVVPRDRAAPESPHPGLTQSARAALIERLKAELDAWTAGREPESLPQVYRQAKEASALLKRAQSRAPAWKDLEGSLDRVARVTRPPEPGEEVIVFVELPIKSGGTVYQFYGRTRLLPEEKDLYVSVDSPKGIFLYPGEDAEVAEREIRELMPKGYDRYYKRGRENPVVTRFMARLRQHSSFKKVARHLKLEFEGCAPGGIWSKRTGTRAHDGSCTGDFDEPTGLPPITFKEKWKWYTWRHEAFGTTTTPQRRFYGGMIEPVDVGDF